MSDKLRFYWVNGRPLSGKDTQVDDLLATRLKLEDVIKISTGNIYREARDQIGRYAVYHAQIAPWVPRVEQGGLVPDHVMLDILQDDIRAYINEGKRTFFFTGVPRTRTQLKRIDNWVNHLPNAESSFIGFYVPRETSIERMYERIKQYKTAGKEPRSDDNLESLRRRLTIYSWYTERMLRKLAARGRLDLINGEADKKTQRLLLEDALDVRFLDPEKNPGRRERF